MSRTSIVVVSYNHRDVLAACVRALDSADLDRGQVRLILVDNASRDGTAELVQRELLTGDGTQTRGGLPAIFIAAGGNLGFGAGNNLALRRAIAEGDEFAYLLNPDTEVEPGFLDAAMEGARLDSRIALVQSLLLRQADPGVINTYGNALHYLGFGYAAGDGERLLDETVQARLAAVREIAFASGAGALVRLSILKDIGLFNEELFLYQEDAELGWRARLAGFRAVIAPGSRVRHRYDFHKGPEKFHWLERNRFLLLLWCYRGRTLLLLLPALLTMEVGVWALAVRGGWWREKARACGYFLRPSRWRQIAATRTIVQALRRMDDREVTAVFASTILFPAVSPWPLTRVANPLLAAYWGLVRRLLRW